MEHLLISDAAKEVQVESHVLRYWEEELKLPIKRNEVGHRYYTDNDIERFKQIKVMKERGLQLKAIKMILKDGKLDVLSDANGTEQEVVPQQCGTMAIEIVDKKDVSLAHETKEEKAQRLQWLLKQLFKETLEENNKELSREIKESVVKELDYQFRCQEERELERNKERDRRDEEYYQRMDALLRKKMGRVRKEKKGKETEPKNMEERKASLKEKKRSRALMRSECLRKAAKNLEKQANLELQDVNWAETEEEAPHTGEHKGMGQAEKKGKIKGNKSPKLVAFKKKRHLL